MPGVNKVLYNLDQRGETTPEERTTARRNIDAISADEVAVLFDDHYKVKQSPINMTFAANAVLRRLYQNANGEIGAECNYIYNATQDTAGLMSPYDKAKLDGIAYGAEQNVQADWNTVDESLDSFIRNKPNLAVFVTHDELGARLDTKQDKLTPGNNITIDANNVISATADPQVQADWAQNDSSQVDYIKHRPQNLVQDPDYVHTDNNFTDADKNKLLGIEPGAEVNVKPDWDAVAGSDAEILNKPDLSVYATKSEVASDLADKQDKLTAGSNITITNNVISATAAPQQNADWNATSGVTEILNKPQNLVQDADYVHTDNNFTTAEKNKLAGIEAGAEANVKPDWTAAAGSDAEILNKPDLSVYATKTEVASDLADKQDTLTAGSNITITNNVISATAAPQQQADWAQTDSSAVDFVKHKPSSKPLVAGANISITESASQVTIAASAAPQQNADWNATSGVTAILNKPDLSVYAMRTDIPLLEWEQTTQGGTNTFASDHLTIHQDTHQVRMQNADRTGDVELGFVVPPVSSAPTENMVLGMASGNTVPTWGPAPSVPQMKDLVAGNGISITPGVSIVTIASNLTAGNGIVVTPGAGGNTVAWEYSVGRNLHVNQNNAIQTNLPGGIYYAPTTMNNNFRALQGADFAGAYRLACRYNTNGTYELALIYTASGMSSTITFIGTETVIGTDNSVTTHAAAYIGESAYYTPSTRFGGSASTPFNPDIHKAIIYDGIAHIGPTSDCKIAIWNGNGTVMVSFVAIEVGKVGATN